jgi:oxygen-dependent protoporphyrinogen oxidase
VITTSKSSPAAKTRFLQVPGTLGIIPIPSTAASLLSSPLRSILIPAVAREVFRRSNRPKGIRDESLDGFMTRRFGEPFARTFGSALIHGIYAADSRKLSVRAAFPSLWEAEERGWGSVVVGFLRGTKSISKDDYDLGNTTQLTENASVYSFQSGMQTLTTALEDHLAARPNISILRNTKVSSLRLQEDKTFEVCRVSMSFCNSYLTACLQLSLSSGVSLSPTHVVSTLSLPVLQTLLPDPNSLPHLSVNPFSSVAVINVIFPAPPSEIHPEGFGYLIPRPASGYSNQSPKILGTVFDSCSLSAQDTPAPLTKLTVMIGGPYPAFTQEHTSVAFVKRHLEDHLQRSLPDPIYWKVRRNDNCIPTLMPGHLDRMQELRDVLVDKWDGRMEVIGAGVGGVSVGDCVEAGKRAGESWS